MCNDVKVIGSVEIWDTQLTIHVGRYPRSGQLYVALQSAEGEPYGVFSTNGKAYGASVGNDAFCVKSYNENEDMVGPMMGTGLFEDTGERWQYGYVDGPIWRIKADLGSLCSGDVPLAAGAANA